jgi:CheY-like chemotaxis protein
MLPRHFMSSWWSRTKRFGSFFLRSLARGYVVSAARGAIEALRIVGSASPDAIFSSLVFDDMDGFELCRHLRAMPGSATSLIVALTGYSEPGIQARAAQAGFDFYLLKPVSVHNMLALLRSFEQRKGPAGFGRRLEVSARSFSGFAGV